MFTHGLHDNIELSTEVWLKGNVFIVFLNNAVLNKVIKCMPFLQKLKTNELSRMVQPHIINLDNLIFIFSVIIFTFYGPFGL